MRHLPLEGLLIGFLAVLAVAGCDSIFGPDEERVLGRFHPETVLSEIPDSVGAGEEFTVGITTHVFGCGRKGETEAEQSGLVVTVRPYDYQFEPRRGSVCVPENQFRHEFTVEFPNAGTGLVRVIGRGFDGEEITVEQEVVVVES